MSVLSVSDQSLEAALCVPLNKGWPTGFYSARPWHAFNMDVYTHMCVCVWGSVAVFVGLNPVKMQIILTAVFFSWF